MPFELYWGYKQMCTIQARGLTVNDCSIPMVQVQIVTYNSGRTLRKCIESVLNQVGVRSVIMVIDNNSSDNSLDIARSYEPKVTCISMPRNYGYGGAHNVGFKRAFETQVEYILTLNPDVELASNYILELIRSCRKDIRCGGVTGKLLRPQSHTEKPVLDSTGLQLERFYHVRDRGSGQPDEGQYNVPGVVWGICGAAALYRTDMLKDIELNGQVFDASFFIYKEDVDLCWRANRRGWYFLYQPTAVAEHLRGWRNDTASSQTNIVLSFSFVNQISLLISHAQGIRAVLVAITVEVVRWSLLFLRRPLAALMAIKLLKERWAKEWAKRRLLKIGDRSARWN